jgi:branched-chain amino acid transport system permease protein
MTWVNAIIQGILLGGLYALFACGLSLLFGVMKVINLAHGDLAILAAYLAVGVIAVTHIPAVWSFIVVVPLFAALGYVAQRTLIQASLSRGVLTTLLVTFGLSVVIENALQQFTSANSHTLPIGSLVTDSLRVGAIRVAWLDVVIFVVAVAVLLGLQYYLSVSRQGRLIRAVADDREAAQLSGADYRHVFGIAAAIAFGTVALAGIAYGMYTSFSPTSGTTALLLLFAFEAVVIGGLGSLWGTLVGGILLGVVQQLGAQVAASDQVLAGQLLFLVILVIRPQGITSGRRTA